MPSAITLALSEHLEGECTTLATLWTVVRRDGVTFRYTDHDAAITFEGNEYVPGVGYDRSALEDKADLSVDNIDIKGILSTNNISREDIRAGLFDGAEVTIRIVNWASPSDGAVIKRKGWFGNVKQNNRGEFDTELRGLSQALSESFTLPYTPGCTVDLGAPLCGVNMVALQKAFVVTAAADRQNFTISIVGDQPLLTTDGTYYNGGVLSFDYGQNDFVAREVKVFSASSISAGTVQLYLRAPFPVEVGDSGLIWPGCTKTMAICSRRFNNGANYQGYPHVPGDAYAKDYPDRR